MSIIFYQANQDYAIGADDSIQSANIFLRSTSAPKELITWDFQADDTIALHYHNKLILDSNVGSTDGVAAEQYFHLSNYNPNKVTDSQRWRYDFSTGFIRNVANPNLVIDDQWRYVTEGNRIWVYSLNGSQAQVWAPEPLPATLK